MTRTLCLHTYNSNCSSLRNVLATMCYVAININYHMNARKVTKTNPKASSEVLVQR